VLNPISGNWHHASAASSQSAFLDRKRESEMIAATANGKCCSLVISMIIGSGIDMVEIRRIQHSIDRYGRRFLDRVFTGDEQAYCLRKRNSAESFAARFAAKEAGAKALGTGISYGVSWLEIEVVREPSGRPTLRLHGRAAQIAARLGFARAALSVTHTAELAAASVVIEDGN
jgi:holo-[acyl-carrier protein] synthase